jgi:hypothetical protein
MKTLETTTFKVKAVDTYLGHSRAWEVTFVPAIAL